MTFSVRDDGQVDACLIDKFPLFNEALSDSISSLPPLGETGNGPSPYWVEVARNALERHLVNGTEGLIASGNSTSCHLENGQVAAKNDYGEQDELETLAIDEFEDLLVEWRQRILEQSVAAQAALPTTYRRNRAAPIAAPSRAEVEDKWQALINGRSNRVATARWARAWAWTPLEVTSEPLVMSALQALDGFDLLHDPTAPNVVGRGDKPERWKYVHSEQHVVEELERWKARIAEHDEDPAGFFQRIRERARNEIRDNRPSSVDTRGRDDAL